MFSAVFTAALMLISVQIAFAQTAGSQTAAEGSDSTTSTAVENFRVNMSPQFRQVASELGIFQVSNTRLVRDGATWLEISGSAIQNRNMSSVDIDFSTATRVATVTFVSRTKGDITYRIDLSRELAAVYDNYGNDNTEAGQRFRPTW